MQDEKLLTHKDLAEFLGVSETTIKSYRRKFPGCIPVANNGKPIRFTLQAKEVAIKIRDYFQTGMSVEEVRARLANEFAWITAEAPAKIDGKATIAPELTQGVSSMAKSMVHISSQQKTILQRVQGIEHILEELGLEGLRSSDEDRRSKLEEKRQKDAYLENRLNNLDSATQDLANTVGILTKEISEFIRQQHEKEKLATIVQHAAANEVTLQAEPMDSSPHLYDAQPVEASCEGMETAQERAIFQQHESIAQEPDRHFLTYPVIVQINQGQYTSAGGRNRGRFSVNDLKAMLIYGCTAPHQFTLEWLPQGNDWWLILKQLEKENGHSIQLLLTELVTQKGQFVEIIQMIFDGVSKQPCEFSGVLDVVME